MKLFLINNNNNNIYKSLHRQTRIITFTTAACAISKREIPNFGNNPQISLNFKGGTTFGLVNLIIPQLHPTPRINFKGGTTFDSIIQRNPPTLNMEGTQEKPRKESNRKFP